MARDDRQARLAPALAIPERAAQPAKAIAAALGVTQSQIARVLGVSEPTTYRLLSGFIPPTPEEARRVAEYLRLAESELWRPERRPRARRRR